MSSRATRTARPRISTSETIYNMLLRDMRIIERGSDLGLPTKQQEWLNEQRMQKRACK